MHKWSTQKHFSSFDSAFFSLSNSFSDFKPNNISTFISSPRGNEIREMLNAGFIISDPRNRVLAIKERNFSTEYLAAELVWYLSGNNNVNWIGRHASFWKSIANADGSLNSAYGKRILLEGSDTGADFRSQWQMVFDELKKDPDSRRAVIHIRRMEDGFDAPDVPCTLSLQFLIRGGKLHLIVNMRSNDLILGTCYDVPAFTLLQEIMALELDLDIGFYYHNTASMHVYAKHYGMIERINKNKIYKNKNSYNEYRKLTNQPMMPLPAGTTMNELHADCKLLLEWDIQDLESSRDAFEVASILNMKIDKLNSHLIRDLARLLATSKIRRTWPDNSAALAIRESIFSHIENSSFLASMW